jgi:hypothetical protein
MLQNMKVSWSKAKNQNVKNEWNIQPAKIMIKVSETECVAVRQTAISKHSKALYNTGSRFGRLSF